MFSCTLRIFGYYHSQSTLQMSDPKWSQGYIPGEISMSVAMTTRLCRVLYSRRVGLIGRCNIKIISWKPTLLTFCHLAIFHLVAVLLFVDVDVLLFHPVSQQYSDKKRGESEEKTVSHFVAV